MNTLKKYVEAFVRFMANAIDAYLKKEAIKRGFLGADGDPVEESQETGGSVEESSAPGFFEWLKEVAPKMTGFNRIWMNQIYFVIDFGGPDESAFYFHKQGQKVVCVCVRGVQPSFYDLSALSSRYHREVNHPGIGRREVSIEVIDSRKPE